MSKNKKTKKLAVVVGVSAMAALIPQAQAQSSSDALIDKLEQKGILSSDEAKELRAEAAQDDTNLISQIPASKWQLSSAIKSIQLFGDVRLRYEYRGADNPWPHPAPGTAPSTGGNTGALGDTYDRERFRYALRFGIRGDLLDDWSYGIRLETSSNPRSQFVTFADDTGKTQTGQVQGGTPSDKTSDELNVGQIYLGYHPDSWIEVTVGKMPMPLYTTPMVWSSSLSPEGAFEKLKYTMGPVDIFADFGQFDYQDPNPANSLATSDTFLLAQQIGANVRMGKTMTFKIAPMVYIYAGHGNAPVPRSGTPSEAASSSIYSTFIGQGDPTGPFKGESYTYNQNGINNLEIVEVPAEFNVRIDKTPLGDLNARIFGDIAYNYEGDDRARAAFAAAPAAFPGLKGAITGQNLAYQAGIGIGSAGPVYGPTQGLVYGTTAKKNTWEARFYYQYVQQYALDVNLMDADFFEGRANLEGFYTAFAYSFTDAIIGTVRYGYANPINDKLGTGGSNPDLVLINPIRNYQLVQMDLTWRF